MSAAVKAANGWTLRAFNKDGHSLAILDVIAWRVPPEPGSPGEPVFATTLPPDTASWLLSHYGRVVASEPPGLE